MNLAYLAGFQAIQFVDYNSLRHPFGLWVYRVSGPVQNNPLSNENGAVILRIRLSSTLQRRKRSPKTEPFENDLQSEAIWKQCFLKTLFSSVEGENDAIWKRWLHQNRHDRAPDHSAVSIQYRGQTLPCGFNFAPTSRADKLKCASVDGLYLSMHTEGITAFSKRIRHCSVDGRKRFQNDKCGRKSFWKRSKTAPFTFENGLVWTELKSAVSRHPCSLFVCSLT